MRTLLTASRVHPFLERLVDPYQASFLLYDLSTVLILLYFISMAFLRRESLFYNLRLFTPGEILWGTLICHGSF
ncbi:hypothetical protein Mapa_011415 [Marchantia paleacea]|nr:hypothetical protein Mapa_011415 [Marchantia paleacea]